MDFERRVLEAVSSRGEAGTRKEARGAQRYWRGFRPRSVMIAVAACLITVLAASAAFAQTSGEIDLLSLMGVKNAVSRPVQGSASDSGLTVHATSAYRDHYLVAVDMKVDGAGDDFVRFGPRSPDDPTATATLSSGQRLRLVAGDSRQGAQAWVLAAPDYSELAGDDLTIVVHKIIRDQPRPDWKPAHEGAPRVYGGSGQETMVTGTWTIKLHLPVQGSGLKDLPAPPADQVGGLRIAFHDIRTNGMYLSVRQDVTEVTPGALGKAWECARLRSPSSSQTAPADACDKPQPLWLAVYDSSGKEVKTVGQTDDLPFAKGGPGPYDPNRTYHWTYMFLLPGPGTYKMVMPGAWPAVTNGSQPSESDLITPHYVQTLTIP